MAAAKSDPPFSGDLDPTAFFQGRTLGQAVIRNPLGGLIRRCEIETLGKPANDFNALHFDERYRYDDGSPEDLMHWAINRTAGTGMEAAELSVLGDIRSELTGACWRVRFKRKARPPADGPTLLYDARFCQVTDDVVIKTVRLALLGVPVAFMTGFHRRLG